MGIDTLDEVEGARVLCWATRAVDGYDGPAGGERESPALLARPETLALIRIGGEFFPSLSDDAKEVMVRSGGECEPEGKLDPCRDEKDTA